MSVFSYQEETHRPTQLGLIALQADETIERDFRRLIPEEIEVLVSRVPSAKVVTRRHLQDMAQHLTHAASLFPKGADLKVIAYGCTSGTAEIGPAKVMELVQKGVQTPHVTEPLSALISACQKLGAKRIAMLSPYIESVSSQLIHALQERDIETVLFGSFAESEEANVVRISKASLMDAAEKLMQQGKADAIFISCTNIRALEVIMPLEERLGIPVVSSNQVLAWNMLKKAGIRRVEASNFGRLYRL